MYNDGSCIRCGRVAEQSGCRERDGQCVVDVMVMAISSIVGRWVQIRRSRNKMEEMKERVCERESDFSRNGTLRCRERRKRKEGDGSFVLLGEK